MHRDEKKARLDRYEAVVQDAGYAIIAEFGMMSVPEVEGFRRELAGVGCQTLVLKNTLARIIFERQGLEEVCEYLVGPSMLLYGQEDIAQAAKTLQRFARRNPALQVKAIVFDERVYPREDFKTFTTLPTKDELYAKFLSVLQAPAVQFVRVLGTAQRLVTVLHGFAGKREE